MEIVLGPKPWSMATGILIYGSLNQAVPQLRRQLGVRLGDPLPALRTEELIHVKSLFSFEHVVDRSAQFMSQDR